MTRTEDRISLSVGNWVALVAMAMVPLGALITCYADLKSGEAVMRVELRQLRDDVADIKQMLRVPTGRKLANASE